MTLRVAKLTKYGPLAAATRQRFDQYDTALTDLDCETVAWPLLEDTYLKRLYSGVGHAHGYLAIRYVDRLRQLVRQQEIDLLWVQYELFPFLPSVAERAVRLAGVPVVYDFDDAIFHNYDLNRRAAVRAILGRKLNAAIGASDCVFAGNEYLAAYARPHCRDVQIVPTVLDTAVYKPISPSTTAADNVPVIGWIGTPSTWSEYLSPMQAMLASVSKQRRAKILAIGAARDAEADPTVELRPWREEAEVSDIQEMDIGIMPLTDTPWARGKCGYKLIQYMACGLPVIASPVGVNSEIVEHGVNGFLASNEVEWREALDALLTDPNLRARMGAAGRKKVEDQYSLQVWGPRVAQMLRDVAVTHSKKRRGD
ncbi:glycosyltransferase family 4 protein [Thioclava sp. F28-4]|uniref:glycosyltransferase family 4 protein n=1 Tax=Thioclava sp. F28-4 TaxID=1915315 RepID=UPI0009976ABC|nr:glycosyltransferase family 4 protein [Thioclava sp. F28-4]OOY04241.1 group 1 glycosyl transferase [Thioclava sp. F28-4]